MISRDRGCLFREQQRQKNRTHTRGGAGERGTSFMFSRGGGKKIRVTKRESFSTHLYTHTRTQHTKIFKRERVHTHTPFLGYVSCKGTFKVSVGRFCVCAFYKSTQKKKRKAYFTFIKTPRPSGFEVRRVRTTRPIPKCELLKSTGLSLKKERHTLHKFSRLAREKPKNNY